MMLRLVNGPEPAIELVDAKANLRVFHDEDDARILALIKAAGAHLERDAGRAFGPQTWEAVLDAFPVGRIPLLWGPVASVEAVTYLDGAGASQVLPLTGYALETAADLGALLPVGSWPVARVGTGSVVVRYVAGLGWPEDVRQAVHLLVGHWYAMREAVAERLTEVPLGVAALLGTHRRMFA